MKRAVYSVLYWIAAVTIGLGAFGHGVAGARALRVGLAGVAIDPTIMGIIWIVWYFVSGCMMLFGVASLWAWFAVRRGAREVFFLPEMIGAFYAIVGVAAFIYGRDPFWLLFLVQGVMLLVGSLGLRGAVDRSVNP